MTRIARQHASELQKIQDIPKVVGIPWSEVQPGILQSECKIFTHYLVGRPPSRYILQKYRGAHREAHMFEYSEADAFERFILSAATKHPFFTGIVDAYTALFSKSSLFRRKMVLLLAILESCAPSCSQFDTPDSTNRVVLLMKLALRGTVFAVSFLISTLLLFPIQMVFSALPKIVDRGD